MKMKTKRISAMVAALVLTCTPISGTVMTAMPNAGIVASAATNTTTLTVRLADPSYLDLNLADVEITLTNKKTNRVVGTTTTDSHGLAYFKDVPAGDYIVSAAASAQYGANQMDVTLTAGKGMTAQLPLPTLASTKASLTVKIIDNDDPNVFYSVAGFTATVTRVADKVEFTETSDENGIISFGTMESGEYIINLTEAPDGYDLLNAPLTVTLKDGVAMTAKMPVRQSAYTANLFVCASNGTPVAEGDATLAGAVYEVYHDGNLYATFTSDENGKLGTIAMQNDEYLGDWTIKMIENPEGYTFNGMENTIQYYDDTAGEWVPFMSHFPEFTSADLSIAMLPISAKLKVAGNPGDNFQIYLKSAETFAKAKTTEKAKLAIARDGSVATTDIMLPYGTYVVENTKTKETVEVMIDHTGIIEVNTLGDGAIMADLTLTIALDAMKPGVDSGDASPDKLQYTLYQNGKSVKTYSYKDLTSGNATYKILGSARNDEWKVAQTDTTSGYYSSEWIITDLNEGANTVGYNFKLPRPILIKGNLTINATPGDTIQYFLTSGRSMDALIEKGDTATYGEFVMGASGTKTIYSLPYGKYTVKNLSTGRNMNVDSIKVQGMEYTTTFPENPNPVTPDPATYTLYNVFGKEVASGEYTPGMDLPVSNGGMYTLTVTTKKTDGNTTTTSTTSSCISINEYGEVSNLPTVEQFGDFDNDGEVDIIDVISMSRFLKGDSATGTNWKAADLNNDGVINVFDLILLKKLIVGLS